MAYFNNYPPYYQIPQQGVSQLQELMEESPDDRTRQEIQKLMAKLG